MIVVDTNIIAYLLIPGARTAEAKAVFQCDSAWVAPMLWRSELRNVLALYLRQGEIKLKEALALFELADEIMNQGEYETSFSEIMRLVSISSCSAYDCEFVALAKDLEIFLITMDKQLLKSFPKIAKSPKQFISSAILNHY